MATRTDGVRAPEPAHGRAAGSCTWRWVPRGRIGCAVGRAAAELGGPLPHRRQPDAVGARLAVDADAVVDDVDLDGRPAAMRSQQRAALGVADDVGDAPR